MELYGDGLGHKRSSFVKKNTTKYFSIMGSPRAATRKLIETFDGKGIDQIIVAPTTIEGVTQQMANSSEDSSAADEDSLAFLTPLHFSLS